MSWAPWTAWERPAPYAVPAIQVAMLFLDNDLEIDALYGGLFFTAPGVFPDGFSDLGGALDHIVEPDAFPAKTVNEEPLMLSHQLVAPVKEAGVACLQLGDSALGMQDLGVDGFSLQGQQFPKISQGPVDQGGVIKVQSFRVPASADQGLKEDMALGRPVGEHVG